MAEDAFSQVIGVAVIEAAVISLWNNFLFLNNLRLLPEFALELVSESNHFCQSLQVVFLYSIDVAPSLSQ